MVSSAALVYTVVSASSTLVDVACLAPDLVKANTSNDALAASRVVGCQIAVRDCRAVKDNRPWIQKPRVVSLLKLRSPDASDRGCSCMCTIIDETSQALIQRCIPAHLGGCLVTAALASAVNRTQCAGW